MSTEVIERPKQSLFQITETLCQMFDMLESAAPEEQDAIRAEIDRVVGAELAAKVDGIVRFDRTVDLEVAGLQDLIRDIENKIGTLNNRKRQVREMTRRSMQTLGTDKLKGDVYTISLRNGSESVEVLDEDSIPAVYFNRKETLSLDKTRVKQALKAGETIPGVQIKVGEPVLTIR